MYILSIGHVTAGTAAGEATPAIMYTYITTHIYIYMCCLFWVIIIIMNIVVIVCNK